MVTPGENTITVSFVQQQAAPVSFVILLPKEQAIVAASNGKPARMFDHLIASAVRLVNSAADGEGNSVAASDGKERGLDRDS